MSKMMITRALTACFLSSLVHAGTIGSIGRDSPWVAAISGGGAWQKAGVQQTFALTADIEKSYTADKITRLLGDVELFLGKQYGINSRLFTEFGMALGVTTDATLSGMIWDDADPLFDNYSYQYKIQHTHLAAKTKLLLRTNSRITPWLSGSMGIGFNNAHGFKNTPILFEAVPNTNFASSTVTAFTYTLGLGLQTAVADHIQVGVGYQFADWGRSKLRAAPGQTLNSGLGLNNFYTNGLLFNLTYVA